MKAGPVLFLLFLLSRCKGQDQNDSFATDNLATMKEEKKHVASLRVSCPDSSDIEPCTCSSNGIVDCSVVQDEEELRNVFSANFPDTELFKFKMHENQGVKVLEDGVFGDVSFEVLEIKDSVLETVSNDALTPSLTKVRDIEIAYNQLTTFPFERLAEFTALRNLILLDNKIQSFPPLSSSSLWLLRLDNNTISSISSDVFTQLPNIRRINLNGNHLTDIEAGTFKDLPDLVTLSISGNEISSLRSLAFDLAPWNSNLDLSHNIIDTVEVDTFKGVTQAHIDLSYNVLTTLEEEVWRPVLEKFIYIVLKANDLLCGCDVAWLVRDSELLGRTSEGTCPDGRNLTDLDPADFSNCR